MQNNTYRILAFAFTLVLFASLVILQPIAAQDKPPRSAVSRELAEMHQADQADRKPPIDWERIKARDKKRRTRVLEIVREEKLASADDYYHAAMVLQHSSPSITPYTPDHYLLAYTLASVAGFEGHQKARWLSAAALDRYFFWTDRRQFFGVQYVRVKDSGWKPGPYSDSLTVALEEIFQLPARVESHKMKPSIGDIAANGSPTVGTKPILQELLQKHSKAMETFSPLSSEDWAELQRRQDRVVDIVQRNQLSSSEDYYHAAQILNEGTHARTLLLAHVLAMAAAFKGETDARSLAAQTLDHYLTVSGEKPFFGLLKGSEEKRIPSGPLPADLVTPSLRKVFGVLIDSPNTN